MRALDIKKFKWEKGGEWFEKWYSTEQCFLAFHFNPLTKSFLTQGLNSVALNTIWYYEVEKSEDWEVTQKEVTNRNLTFYKHLIQEAREYIEAAENTLSQISNLKMVDLKTLELIQKALMMLWYVFLADIGKYLGDAIENLLRGENLPEEQLELVKNYYLTTHKPLAYQEEEENLKRIFSILSKFSNDVTKVKLNQVPGEVVKKLKEHKNQFSWLFTSDLDTEPPTIKHYLKRIQELSEVGKQINQVIELPKSMISSISKDKITVLECFNELLYLDNYTADVYQKIDFIFQQLLSKEHKVSFKALSWYTWHELEALVKEDIKLSDQELEIRKKYRVMVQIDGKIGIFYSEKYFKQISKLLNVGDAKFVKSFKGTKASLGCAQGVAKVVRGIKEMDKVEVGDIIVANTTRPDLMPALRKCIAIVTDHGGVTSHAAIVSRELKIPCIVGTKIATEVVRDGDLVEVDADEGIVRILG